MGRQRVMQEDGAKSQDESPSEAIYSSPSWVILPGPDHH